MEQQVVARRLLRGGIVGPFLFIAVFLVDGATRPGYDPLRHFVSGLLLGDRGWVETLSFVLSGLLIAALAVGMRQALRTGLAARGAPVAVGVVGLGLIVAGLFPGDPAMGYPPGAPEGLPDESSWHANVHYAGAVMIFGALPVASMLIARRAWRHGDPPIGIYSVASGVAVVAFYLVAVVLAAGGGPAADLAGLVQRLAIVSGFQWLMLVSVLLLGRRPALVAVAQTRRSSGG